MELKNVEIIKIDKLKEFANDFKLVEFVVKDQSSQYPQFITLQAIKDKAENLLKFNKVGDIVDCSINIRGREWTNPEGEVKYFNSIEAWKIFKSENNTIEDSVKVIDAAFEPVGYLNEDDKDDLPF